MKTIAVLTDHSESSAHAAKYALHLAKKMKANVWVFNNSPVLAGHFEPQLAWADDSGLFATCEMEQRLVLFTSELGTELKERSFPGASLPEIAYDGNNWEMADVMAAIVNNPGIELVVMPLPDGADIATFVMSDECRNIIDSIKVPVLIVPAATDVRNPEKIAFSANLDGKDTGHINSLIQVLGRFNAEIMVTCVNGDRENMEMEEKALRGNIYANVDYGQVYYRSLTDERALTGWKWLRENKKCDMLAMVQQSSTSLKQFFDLGKTGPATYHINIPILISPAVN